MTHKKPDLSSRLSAVYSTTSGGDSHMSCSIVANIPSAGVSFSPRRSLAQKPSMRPLTSFSSTCRCGGGKFFAWGECAWCHAEMHFVPTAVRQSANTHPLNTTTVLDSTEPLWRRCQRKTPRFAGNQMTQNTMMEPSRNRNGTILAMPNAPSPRGMIVTSHRTTPKTARAVQMKNVQT